MVSDGLVDNMSCERPWCSKMYVPVTENLAEISTVFYRVGYCVSKAFDYYESVLIIAIEFRNNTYSQDLFPNIPAGWKYFDIESGGLCRLEYIDTDYKEKTKIEQEDTLENALAEIYAWILKIENSGTWAVWLFAGYFDK